VRAWWLLTRTVYRAQLEYRANLLLSVLGGILYQTTSLAVIGVILARFGSVGGWGLPEMAFLYGLRLTAHGLFMVALPLSDTDTMVRSGEFDRFLVRPAGLFAQSVTRRAPIVAFGDLIGGVTILVVAAANAPVRWTVLSVVYLGLAVVGGALLEGAFQVAAAGLAFRMLSTMHVRLLVDAVFGTFGNYPLRIFGAGVRFTLTFLFPLAFLAYLPASVLLDRTGELSVPGWLALLAPAVGALLFGAAYLFWHGQIRHYSSSGN